MAMLCNISSEIPEHPVLNTKSNLIYERRLIEKHLHQYGNDPVTNEASVVDDLIDIKIGRVIKPASKNASVPSMLLAVQDEWDALALQNFTLKQQLHVTRQELSHALYQHDAACRVIARVQKELAMAKQALIAIKSVESTRSETNASMSSESTVNHDRLMRDQSASAVSTSSEANTGELTDADITKINETALKLSDVRKNRSKDLPAGPTTEEMVGFTEQKKFPLHSVSQSGITCLDLHYPSERIATGGNDKEIIVFDKHNEHIITALQGHAGRISRVRWHPREDADVVISASHDASVRIWSVKERNFLHQFQNHTGPVTGLSIHPTGDYVLSGGSDALWALSSTHTGQLLLRPVDADLQDAIQDCSFHPDGKLMASALRSGTTQIYDAASNTCVANLNSDSASDAGVTPVTALCFSENGYHYYVAHRGAAVVCWDLRKLKTARTIDLPTQDSVVNDIHVDYAAKYLGLAGTSQTTGLYQCKGMQALLPLDSHGASAVTGIRFARDARYVITTSQDRYLRIFY